MDYYGLQAKISFISFKDLKKKEYATVIIYGVIIFTIWTFIKGFVDLYSKEVVSRLFGHVFCGKQPPV